MNYMTTKEFLRKIEELGYTTNQTEDLIKIVKKYGWIVATVSESEYGNICSDFNAFSDLTNDKKSRLLDVLYDYITTPVDEREEKEKYYLMLDEIGKGHCRYINFNIYTDEIIIGDRTDMEYWKTKFTDEEIEELRNKFPKLVGIATKVKVEE